jgi:plasmid stabilization system protein ParE
VPVWLAQAEDDLIRNIEHYAEDDPLAAWQIYEQVIERAEILDAQPGIGRTGRVRGTREFVLAGTPFILVYRQIGKSVERSLPCSMVRNSGHLHPKHTASIHKEMKYLIIIEKSETGYSTYSPDLPGCISTGATPEETEANMKEGHPSFLSLHF